ncbi:BTAD domain-containing putative transcriptional regulator [Streptomyces sp. ODS28]|uniref:AfsR/SARP family transcriptional regulator n=1 Tax=Streptomyces sp. ODS28 TaxID=3136688 RepID=UPI0031E984C3
MTAQRRESEVPLSGSKIRTVLAQLLLARGRVVSDSRLSEMLWGHTPPSTLNSQIYTYVSRLRKHLGPEVDIARQGPGYVLDAPSSRVDVFEFERLTALGQRALGQCDYASASRYLGEGIALWQGEPLEYATEHLQDVEVPRLEAARLTALEHRIEADLALGRHHQICAELVGLVARFPLHERLRAQLITTLYRCGRQSEAVRAYHDGRTALAEQMGVDPGPELRAAYEAMLRGEMGEEAGAREPAMAPNTLPPDTVPFTGRTRELTALTAMLLPRRARDERGEQDGRGERDGRGDAAWEDAPEHASESASGPAFAQPARALVTGMTGSGKSCLAVHAAHIVAPHYADGQLHADLTHPDGRAKTPSEVLVRLLRTLGEPRVSTDHAGFSALAEDTEELVRLYRTRTAGKRLFLLLDNAVGDAQLGPLLPSGRGSAVLITSRTRLTSVTLAHTLVLEPMSEEESLRLLEATAGPQRVRAEHEMARTVVRQCAGLPLALRIAGARLASRPHWPVAELAHRLADPGRRLEELRLGDLDVIEALNAALAHLPLRTRKVFPWLSMLGGDPFTASAAGAALGLPELQAERALEDLVDASFMTTTPTLCGTPKYQFPPLILLFAEALPNGGKQLQAA